MCSGGKSSTGPLESYRGLHLPSSPSQQEAINKPLLPSVDTNITAPKDTRWLLAEGGRKWLNPCLAVETDECPVMN